MSYPTLIERGGLIPHRGGLFAPPDGLGPVAFGPKLLLALDYTQPTQQNFPTTTTAMSSLTGATPTHVLLCDESSSPLVDEVLGKEFAESNSPLFGRVAPPLWDGTSAFGKTGVEFTGVANQQVIDSDSDLTLTGSVAILLVFRVSQLHASGSRRIGSWFGGDLVLDVNATGSLRLRSGGNVQDTSEQVAVGAVHAAVIGKHVTADESRILNVIANAAATDVTTNPGDYTDGQSGIGGPGATAFSGQVIAAYTFEDGDAETMMTEAALDAFWTHAKDPGTGGVFPVLDTYTRASLTAPEIGSDGGSLRRAKYGPGQFAHAYRSAFSHASKLGLYIADARTNLIGESADFSTTWDSTGGITVTANDAESADGSQTADRLAATANDGFTKYTVTTVAATEYTAWFDVQRVGGSDVSGRLIIYDETGAAELAAQAFTATADIQRVSVTATTNGGQVSTSIRVEIDTDTEAVYAWEAGFALGKLTEAIPTDGGSASRATTGAILDNPGGNTYLRSDRGEIEIVCALDTDVNGASRVLVDVNDGSTANDRIQTLVNGSGQVVVAINDASGSLVQSITAADPGNWDQEHTIRIRWNSEEGVDGNAENADVIVDGVRTAGAATSWAAGTNATKLYPGSSRAVASYALGTLATVKVWDDPRQEAI